MEEIIYLKNSQKIVLPTFPDKIEEEIGGKNQWTFIGTYDLRELRDVFLVFRQFRDLTKQENYQKIKELVSKTNKNQSWSSIGSRERDILEYQNTLENLGIIDYDKTSKKINIKNFILFQDSNINQPLSIQDKIDFKTLFLNYSRFREVLNWFSNNFSFKSEDLVKEVFSDFDFNKLILKSKPFYSFNRNSNKSVDSIIYSLEDNTTVYTIDDSNKNFIRFWNVFVTIGEELNIVNSFSYPAKVFVQSDKDFNYHLRAIRFNYIVNENIDFDIIQYLKSYHQNEKYIGIPELIRELVLKFRYPIRNIREEIVNQCDLNKNLFSLQRTSFVFIENKDVKFYPMIDNYYMSHILLRR